MDEVTFGRNGRDGHERRGDTGAESDVYECLFSYCVDTQIYTDTQTGIETYVSPVQLVHMYRPKYFTGDWRSYRPYPSTYLSPRLLPGSMTH